MEGTDVSTESSVRAPDVLDDMHVDVRVGQRWNWRQFCSFVGSSGLVVVAYLDPGNLESDLQIGALSTPDAPNAAHKFLWVLLLATFCGWILQGMSVHTGIYSGTDLCSLTRIRYPRWVSVTMWLVVEIAILSADIQALIGTGMGINGLTGIPLGKSTAIGFVLTFAVFCTKVGIKPLEWIFFCLLLATGSIFISAAVVSRPDVGDVILGSVLPVLPRRNVFQAIGLMGSLLMPHTILVQSALVNSRHYLSECPFEQTRQRSVVASYVNAENAFGLTCSFLVNAAVLLVFSAAAAKTSQEHGG
ncbi:MAG: uncharacterized protein KVP18_002667 [Porospora cf. gigantea A]|uniref:uncharacterized protein n=1 Tax=Porospora cf. gigantea A TaxID=2853593 RepID=UPI00355A1C4B|nr:MAG: hypothetical protein KVP18_002667 [Porospora cf. gigantea A]